MKTDSALRAASRNLKPPRVPPALADKLLGDLWSE
jgi:hypothetical protein